MSFDKSIILAAVAKLERADGSQARIITDVLSQMNDLPHASRIEICKEAVKSFPSEAKKAGGKGYSQYQYASRMGAIVGAAFLVQGFKVQGGVNAVYRAAGEALKKAGLRPDGTTVEAANAEKEQETRAKLEAEQTAKLVGNNPNMTGAEIAQLAAVAVDRQLADAALAKVQESAEKYAQRMVENQGFDYALEFATAVLKAVKAQAPKLAAAA